MTVFGAVAVAIAAAAAVLGVRRASPIERRVRALDGGAPRARRGPNVDRLVVGRVAGGLGGATVGATVAWLVGGGALPVAVMAYVGATLPAVVVERRQASRCRDAERACVTLVEWLCALVAAGRPIEAALVNVTARGGTSAMLDEALLRVRRDYTLGVPLHVAAIREGERSGIRGLTELGARLERARTLGRGAASLVEDLRNDLRAAERARALRAASSVEGKLTLVMTLCYLPALALLVIVPLFLTLLNGLFA